MKVTEDLYHIKKRTISGNKKFLSFSDIHYGTLQQMFYKGTMKRFFNYLVETNKDVDIILVPGDLLFYFGSFKDKKFLTALIYDLEDLSNRIGAPICISYGNHDLPLNESKMTDEEKRELELGQYLDNRPSGIYVLDNEQVKFDNVVVTGFSPRRDSYNQNLIPNGLSSIKESFDKCNFRFSKGNINILMSHENKFVSHSSTISEYGDLYEYLTFIIGGHLHDGYMPIWFQNICRGSLKDYGLWEKIPPQINMCRGLFKVSKSSFSDVILPTPNQDTLVELQNEECASIVNRGVAKYSWYLPSRPSCTKIEVSSSCYQAEDGSCWVDEEYYKAYLEGSKIKIKK